MPDMIHRLWKPEGGLQHFGVTPEQPKPKSLPLTPVAENYSWLVMWTGICWDSSSWCRVTNNENKWAVCPGQSFIKWELSSPASPVSKNLQEVQGHMSLQLIAHGHHPPSPRPPKIKMHLSFLHFWEDHDQQSHQLTPCSSSNILRFQ